MMRLVVVSGLSGSGKSVALNTLEDLGWFCVDNIPAGLLQDLVAHTLQDEAPIYQRVAVGLDARNRPGDLDSIPSMIADFRRSGIRCEEIYLHASDQTLLRRFAETRRRHPLAADGASLAEAIAAERALLHSLADAGDLVVDTSAISIHSLRELIRRRVDERRTARLAILFQSFAYKTGIPGDADFVFDARTLPNPYWDLALRPLTGRDPLVQKFLEASPAVSVLLEDIARFLEARIPEFERNNRAYLTVAVGCTGGQHRSVYLVEQLAARFTGRDSQVLARHTGLP